MKTVSVSFKRRRGPGRLRWINATAPTAEEAYAQIRKSEAYLRLAKQGYREYGVIGLSHRDPPRRARRDEVPSPRRHKWVEDGMLLGFLEAIWLDSYMSWAEEHGHGYTTGHIPQHVRGLSDIPQAPPLAAKKLAKKYASLLVKMNKATLSQIFMRAAAAEEKRGRARIDVDPVKLGFYLAMQSRGHGVSWTDDHAAFKVKLPSAEWYAYGPKGRVRVEGYVSERFAGDLS